MRPRGFGFFFLGRDSAVKDIRIYLASEETKQLESIAVEEMSKRQWGSRKLFLIENDLLSLCSISFNRFTWIGWLVNGFLALLG